MIKKIFVILLCVALAMSLGACSLVRPATEPTVTTRTEAPEKSEPQAETEATTETAVDTLVDDPSAESESLTATDTEADTETGTESESVTEGESTTEATTETETESETLVPPVIPAPEPGAPKTICIDAGHGYVDPGCTSDYLDGKYERDIVADYANSLKAELEARGYRVILLHTEDRYVTMDEVAEAARARGMKFLPDKLVDDGRFAAYNRTVWANVLHRDTYIDLLVSIHIDAFPSNESVAGTRIYYCGENNYSSDSANLVTSLAAGISGKLPKQSVRTFVDGWEDAFIVTKHADMPSTLIEIGFATNEDEAKNILDADWQESFVGGMADGIEAYFG